MHTTNHSTVRQNLFTHSLVVLFVLFTGTSLHANPQRTSGPIAQQATMHYADMAQQRYQLSFDAARELTEIVQTFLADPNPETHQAAKDAWVHAHNIYSETEVFRFGNPNVDAWEGKVNAWPIDEGYIDYVSDQYVAHVGNPHARHNIIGSTTFPIRDEIIAEYQAGTDPKAAPSERMTDVETNVAIGYHAIEFLLWGQDLNVGPDKIGGNRSYTDYLQSDLCTNGNCRRRSEYLSAACRVLVQDLQFMLWDWSDEGRYRKEFDSLPAAERLSRIFIGMGSLSHAELAGERMRVALITSDQEEEQNCFSDTTHNSIYYNALGIKTIYEGAQKDTNGDVMRGVSLSQLVRRVDPQLDKDLRQQFQETMAVAREMMNTAEGDIPFDQMIQPDQVAERELLEKLMRALAAQTQTIEKILAQVDQLAAI